MDPEMTLTLVISALVRGDAGEAKQHASNLRDWLARGGFPPSRRWRPYLCLLGMLP